jgi:hypothetical protein
LVSISFGATPAEGPTVVKCVARETNDATAAFDLDRHVAEVLEGVADANAEVGGSLQVEAIQIVPNDYPSSGQARYAAYLTAKHVLGAT